MPIRQAGVQLKMARREDSKMSQGSNLSYQMSYKIRLGWSGRLGTAIYLTLYMTVSFLHHRRVLGVGSRSFHSSWQRQAVSWKMGYLLDFEPYCSCSSFHHPLGNHVSHSPHLIVKTSIRPNAAPCPTFFCGLCFFARQVQVVLAELDGGVVRRLKRAERPSQDIVGVYLSEGLQDLRFVWRLYWFPLLGNSYAWEQLLVGIGNVAITYGFNRYNHDADHLGDYQLSFDYLYNPVLGEFLLRISHK